MFSVIRIPNSGSASSKSKVTRSTKSNADLCNELREFISMTGLPKNSVPSIKVLSEHGRKDLANIVRRRGYKLITVLLQDTAEVDVDADIEDISLVNDGACNIDAIDSTDGKEKGVEALHEDESLASKAQHHSSTNEAEPIVFDFQVNDSIGYSVNSTLHEKALNFVQNGVLEQIEGAPSAEEIRMLGGSDISHANVSITGSISVLGHAKAENDMVEAATWGQVTSVLESNGGCAGSNVNAGEAEFLAEDHKTKRDDSLPSKELNSPGRDQDSVQTSKKENQAEINHLKEMLQQKESELSQLKQQIEDEKLALSIMQSKANDELGNAQRFLLEKDAELLAAEETLSGLKEVEIQYWADGAVVEVAGSFNGWQQPIKMDCHVSSEAISPKGGIHSLDGMRIQHQPVTQGKRPLLVLGCALQVNLWEFNKILSCNPDLGLVLVSNGTF
ncbi:hypothetical protein ACLOJK_015889 [Asimina triloba]